MSSSLDFFIALGFFGQKIPIDVFQFIDYKMNFSLFILTKRSFILKLMSKSRKKNLSVKATIFKKTA